MARTQRGKKWVLLSWSWLTKLLKERGLGLCDFYILTQVMGAKLWWRWIQGGVDLWKRLWERKYDMHRSLEGNLRSQNDKKGYAIWNLVSANKNLISNHSFWEIRGGDKSNFWEKAWQ